MCKQYKKLLCIASSLSNEDIDGARYSYFYCLEKSMLSIKHADHIQTMHKLEAEDYETREGMRCDLLVVLEKWEFNENDDHLHLFIRVDEHKQCSLYTSTSSFF